MSIVFSQIPGRFKPPIHLNFVAPPDMEEFCNQLLRNAYTLVEAN
jgi:hypothetical protein